MSPPQSAQSNPPNPSPILALIQTNPPNKITLPSSQIDLEKFAQLGPYATRASANTAWHKLRRKLADTNVDGADGVPAFQPASQPAVATALTPPDGAAVAVRASKSASKTAEKKKKKKKRKEGGTVSLLESVIKVEAELDSDEGENPGLGEEGPEVVIPLFGKGRGKRARALVSEDEAEIQNTATKQKKKQKQKQKNSSKAGKAVLGAADVKMEETNDTAAGDEEQDLQTAVPKKRKGGRAGRAVLAAAEAEMEEVNDAAVEDEEDVHEAVVPKKKKIKSGKAAAKAVAVVKEQVDEAEAEAADALFRSSFVSG